jgi:hypothetical protein
MNDIIDVGVNPANDIINHPSHYTRGKVEVVDIIEDVIAGITSGIVAYHFATVLKYSLRAPFKGAMLQDCRKARWHLDRMIGIIERDESGEQRENTG